MKPTKIILAGFILLCIVQLGFVLNMTIQSNKVLNEGTVFNFITAPVDPNDPFRGKYVTLNFEENSFCVPDTLSWKNKKIAYAEIGGRYNGFAFVVGLTLDPPPSPHYVEVKIRSVSALDSCQKVFFEYPFNKFYMEEGKAAIAEQAYREAQNQGKEKTWAVVSIQNGESVLQDVMINNVSLRDISEENQEADAEEKVTR